MERSKGFPDAEMPVDRLQRGEYYLYYLIMTLRRFALFAVPALLVVVLAVDLVMFDRSAWQEDYMNLKQDMAQGYANLDWQVDKRNLDLQALDRRTSKRLAAAYSHVQAYRAINDFVASFNDPHLALEWGDAPAAAVRSNASSSLPAAKSACAGDGDVDRGPLSYRHHPDYKAIGNGPFAAGLIGKTAIVRIPSFGEDKYEEFCRTATARRSGREATLAARAGLSDVLLKTLTQLQDAGGRNLIVDVAGNGGGSEWATDVARLLGSGAMTRMKPRLADPTCDRQTIWQGRRPCPVYQASIAQEPMQGERRWSGAIAILIDRNSASATEEFVVWMKDNGLAKIVGERTYGAGCGYVDGGLAVPFSQLPLHVMIPNCSRFRKSGKNELEGIQPDVAVDWEKQDSSDYAALFARIFSSKS